MDLNCTECGGLGWVETRAAGCPKCNPPIEKPKRQTKARRGVRKQSERRAAIEAVHAPFREQLKAEVGRCDFCNEQRPASDLDEHHIGRNRWREIGNPRRTAIVCKSHLKGCHEAMDDLDPKEQVAVVARAMLRAVQRVMK